MSERHPGWDGILDDDEDIIWQGAPDGKFRFKPEHPTSIVIGFAFLAISTPNLLVQLASPTLMIIFPLAVFCLGIYSLIGVHFYETWQRQGTFYTLTTRRAFIGSRDFKGKTLDSYVITPKNRIRLKDTNPPTVYFATQTKRSGQSRKTVNVGFRYIEDAQDVLNHLRAMQERASA